VARGAVIAAVNYRLAPEHPYPTSLLDCLDAILYIWRSATSMGLVTRQGVPREAGA
jgi:acetyl esterase/lipase